MIHPGTLTTSTASSQPALPTNPTPPQVLDLSFTSLATPTVLDLSNPSVLATLATPLVITPNTEAALLTLSAAISAQGLGAALPTEETAHLTQAAAMPAAPAASSVADDSSRAPSPPESTCSESVTDVELEKIDPSVAKAVQDAAKSGSLTPLIKTELKCTIQQRRLLEGKAEVQPEELLRPASEGDEELSAEEQARRQRRRERNKVAAQRCRNRRRDQATQLEEEAHELEEVNRALKEEIEGLEREKEKLKRMMTFHDDQQKSCPKRTKLSEADEELVEEEVLDMDIIEDGFDLNDESIQIVIAGGAKF